MRNQLKLNDCNQLTDLSIFAFADNCHDLLEIDLYKCTNITDQAVTALIKEGKQLRELRLAACMGITDEAFLHLPADSTYDALRILDLTDCHELKDDGLMKIVQAAPRLRNLVLAKCRNITDRGVMSITKLGKNLHFLHLGHCSNITDAGVIQLIKHCNRIRYIDFACCTRLTDDSVQQLANLPKLKRIGLVKCANITDLSIQALALRPKLISGAPPGYATNNLERLHLSYCSNLSIAVRFSPSSNESNLATKLMMIIGYSNAAAELSSSHAPEPDSCPTVSQGRHCPILQGSSTGIQRPPERRVLRLLRHES